MPTTCPGSLQALHSSLTDAVDRVDGAALAWAASGAMSLTGAADGPPRQVPVPVATGLEATAEALSQFGGIEVDGPALLGERAAIAGLGGAALAAWAVCRILGTAVLVPVVEEAFFRGYVLTRLDSGTWASRVAAVAVSSALFALLHGRIVAAGAAGVVFALVMLRRGRLADAILAHGLANALIAAVALWRGAWSLI